MHSGELIMLIIYFKVVFNGFQFPYITPTRQFSLKINDFIQ